MISIRGAGITAAMLYAALFAYRVADTKLQYFSPAEFGVWYPLIDKNTLLKLDQFRARLGFAVAVSTVEGATGRLTNEHSQHFPAPFVRAVDVFPQWPNGGTPQELERAYKIAVDVGFTGIGIYPDTKPRPMMHLDTRPGTRVATWARYKTASGHVDKPINTAFV